MEIFRFDRAGKIVRGYGSKGFRATRIAAGDGHINLTCLTVEPGGVIGTLPAAEAQLLLVIAGDGWTAGPDGRRVPITAGWAASAIEQAEAAGLAAGSDAKGWQRRGTEENLDIEELEWA